MKYIYMCLIPAALCTQAAEAARTEKVKRAIVTVKEECSIIPLSVTEGEWKEEADKEFLGPIIVGLLGGLAQAGVSALGGALEKASEEKGFVATGETGLHLLNITGADAVAPTSAKILKSRMCVSLFLPSTSKKPGKKLTQELSTINAKLGAGQKIKDDALSSYSDKLPAVYIEAHYMPIRGGAVLRPAFVWYREKFKGAPSGKAVTEFHVSFSLPSAEKDFAVARIPLPKVGPGQILGWDEMKFNSSPIIAGRPNSEDVDKELSAINLKIQQYQTAQLEKVKAERAAQAAKTKRDAYRRINGKHDPDLVAAVTLAEDTLSDADKAETRAQAAAQAAEKPISTGATNVKARFVVVRQPNKFGLAIATALKGQAEAVGKAVTSELSPKPDWTENDTAFVTATSAVETKQREYDKAIADGKGEDAEKLNDELNVLKAKVNEAAVGINRPPVYLDLIS